MVNIWSWIGVVFGILFMFLLVSSMQVDDERQNSRCLMRDYDQEDDLLNDLEELILMEDLEEELEDEGYYNA